MFVTDSLCRMNSSDGNQLSTLQAPSITVPTTTDGGSVSSVDDVVILRTTILTLLLILSLVGNALVMFSVAQASKSRFNPFNAFLISLAIYGLVECALNLSLAIGFSVERQWMFGEFLIGFNASFVQLQNVGVMLTILFMSVDRYVATTWTSKYHSAAAVHKANYAVLYTWIHAFLFALPLLFQNQMIGIKARDFVERCLCGLQEGTAIGFTVTMVILCIALPIVLAVVFISLVVTTAWKERKKLISANSPQYANYLIQQSAILKEARCCRFVTVLFVLYLIFKLPYQTIDFLTQLSVGFAYIPVASDSGNHTEAMVHTNTKFYYQTVLTWMLFCFSALYPILTFLYFRDHWRRLRTCLCCGTATVSIANSHGNRTTNLRQIRQKERRRQKHPRQLANRNNNNSRTPKGRSSANGHVKAPSSVSSNITSEKVAVNGSSSQDGGEVLFRVPVLYAGTDGLHLVASEKTLAKSAKTDHRKRRKTGSSEGQSSNAVTSLNGTDTLDATNSSKSSKVDSADAQAHEQIDEELRPSSVVDKRVDVIGSRDGLNDVQEETGYINSDFDDDTESELNESANSRTLIWPHHHSSGIKSSSVATVITSPSAPSSGRRGVEPRSAQPQGDSLVCLRQSFHSYQGNDEDEDNSSIVHPHTPTPPPDEDPRLFIKPASPDFGGDSDSDNTIIDKTASRRNKLVTRRSKSVAAAVTKQLRPISQSGGIQLLRRSLDGSEEGLANFGYGSVSGSPSHNRDSKDFSGLGHKNKIHPNAKSTSHDSYKSPDLFPVPSLDGSFSWKRGDVNDDLVFVDLDQPLSSSLDGRRGKNKVPFRLSSSSQS